MNTRRINLNIFIVFLILFNSCKTTIYKYEFSGSGTLGDFYVLERKKESELFIPNYANNTFYYDSCINWNERKVNCTSDYEKLTDELIYPFKIKIKEGQIEYDYNNGVVDTFLLDRSKSFQIDHLFLSKRISIYYEGSMIYKNFNSKYVNDTIILFNSAFPKEAYLFHLYPNNVAKDSVASPILLGLDKATGIPLFLKYQHYLEIYGGQFEQGCEMKDYKKTFSSKKKIKKLLFL